MQSILIRLSFFIVTLILVECCTKPAEFDLLLIEYSVFHITKLAEFKQDVILPGRDNADDGPIVDALFVVIVKLVLRLLQLLFPRVVRIAGY